MWADEVRHGLAGTLVIYLSSLLKKKMKSKLLNNTDQVNVVQLQCPLDVFMRLLAKPT